MSSAVANTEKRAHLTVCSSMQEGHIEGLGILVKRFPKLSETFIQGEIEALVKSGVSLQIISLHRPSETLRQPLSHGLLERVSYLGELTFSVMLLQWFKLFALKPLRACKSVAGLWREGINPREFIELVLLCKRMQLQHIHVHYISYPAALADLVSQCNGIGYSVSAHAKDIFLTSRKRLIRRIQNARFIATCTASNRDFLHSLAADSANKVHLVYHGINSDFFCPVPVNAQSDVPDRLLPARIVAMGRFKEKKGFDVLIDACAILIRQGHNILCDVIGYGDQKQFLQHRIDGHEIGHAVRLCRPVTHASLVQILHNATVFVMPSRRGSDGDMDGIPNAMLEAMSCAVPVVATNVSGIPEAITHCESGLLVEPDNASALSGAISQLLTDADLSVKLGGNGRLRVVRQFNWQASIRYLSRLFNTTRIAPFLKDSPHAGR